MCEETLSIRSASGLGGKQTTSTALSYLPQQKQAMLLPQHASRDWLLPSDQGHAQAHVSFPLLQERNHSRLVQRDIEVLSTNYNESGKK